MTPTQFWKKHLNYFVLLVSEFYPIPDALLEKYQKFWLWNRICQSQFIHFTSAQLEKYKNHIDWMLYIKHYNLPYRRQTDYLFYQSIKWDNYSWRWPGEFAHVANDLYFEHFTQYEKKNVMGTIWFDYWNKPYQDFEFYPYRLVTKVIPAELDKIINDIPTPQDTMPPYVATHLPLDFIEKYQDILDWYIIERTDSFPWSFESITKYESRFRISELYYSHKLLEFALKPFISDAFIEEVLNGETPESIISLSEFEEQPYWDYVQVLEGKYWSHGHIFATYDTKPF